MAIQKINLGTEPLGEGGDTYRSANTKINENFSNTEHAASKLVGTEAGRIPLANKARLAASKPDISRDTVTDVNSLIGTDMTMVTSSIPNAPTSVPGSSAHFVESLQFESPNRVWQISYASHTPEIQMRMRFSNASSFSSWVRLYHTGNTTKDTATGFLKASSPVLHVYNDNITKIHEAEQLDITVDKKGVGHYEIHGTTGLRKNDGWFMSPPRDVHGNVLCMVDLDEKDGVIILKTYKKMFDFESVSIVHDYDNPMDIPDGVCVEFRFNDLPEEELEYLEPAEENLVEESE